MPLVSTRALVLQTFQYGETSKILRLYTLEHGLRSAIARGAQRPRSRYGGVLEPFTEGQATLFLKDGRDLHTLSGFDLLRSRQQLGRDLQAFAGASLAAELVLRFGTEEPSPQLFEALTRALDRLGSAPRESVAAEALAAVWLIVSLLGYQPEMEACVRCGRVLEGGEPSRFDVEAGGVACADCRPAGRSVPASVRDAIARMCSGSVAPVPPTDLDLHRALLRVFLAAHLFQEHPLRSLDLFLGQLR